MFRENDIIKHKISGEKIVVVEVDEYNYRVSSSLHSYFNISKEIAETGFELENEKNLLKIDSRVIVFMSLSITMGVLWACGFETSVVTVMSFWIMYINTKKQQ